MSGIVVIMTLIICITVYKIVELYFEYKSNEKGHNDR